DTNGNIRRGSACGPKGSTSKPLDTKGPIQACPWLEQGVNSTASAPSPVSAGCSRAQDASRYRSAQHLSTDQNGEGRALLYQPSAARPAAWREHNCGLSISTKEQ